MPTVNQVMRFNMGPRLWNPQISPQTASKGDQLQYTVYIQHKVQYSLNLPTVNRRSHDATPNQAFFEALSNLQDCIESYARSPQRFTTAEKLRRGLLCRIKLLTKKTNDNFYNSSSMSIK